MSAPTRRRAEPVVECDVLVLKRGLLGWTWTLRAEDGHEVARQAACVASDTQLARELCGVFDLRGTPEYYAARIRNHSLKQLESASRTRWLEVRFE